MLKYAPCSSNIACSFFGLLFSPVPTHGVAVWNGSAWNELGNSILEGENPGTYIELSNVLDIAFFQNGNVLAVGSFLPSTLTINRLNMALWNGSVWARQDTEINYTSDPSFQRSIGSCLISPKDDIYIGLYGVDGAAYAWRGGGTR